MLQGRSVQTDQNALNSCVLSSTSHDIKKLQITGISYKHMMLLKTYNVIESVLLKKLR